MTEVALDNLAITANITTGVSATGDGGRGFVALGRTLAMGSIDGVNTSLTLGSFTTYKNNFIDLNIDNVGTLTGDTPQ